MKKIFFTGILVIGLVFVQNAAYGQFRDKAPTGFDYTGNIIRQNNSSNKNFLDIAHMTMHQSLDFSVGTIGGNVFNENLFTNSMLFDFTPRLTGRMDVSLSMSPFSNNFMTGNKKAAVFIRNADLNYQIGEHGDISIHFSQNPYGYYNPFTPYGYSYGYDPYNPFGGY